MTFIDHVELALGMELTLNLGWVVLAALMLWVWLRMTPGTAKDRRLQFVALAVVILILLPAISMTDDLVAAQNPAEIDCCARRDHGCNHFHPIIPLAAVMPVPGFQGLAIRFSRVGAPRQLTSPLVENPSLSAIENRPPPVA